jgi:hypothetical protein
VDFHRFQTLKKTSLSEARVAFADFKAALTCRIEWEDETLLPAFDRKLGALAGTITARFRTEHDQIRSLLSAIDTKLTKGDPATESEETALEALLGSHNHWEHEIVYPAVELQMTADRSYPRPAKGGASGPQPSNAAE